VKSIKIKSPIATVTPFNRKLGMTEEILSGKKQ
jgi:hypothetical protein